VNPKERRTLSEFGPLKVDPRLDVVVRGISRFAITGGTGNFEVSDNGTLRKRFRSVGK
jgi:hypothetical protein